MSNESVVFMSFEEKTEELELNVRSFGFDLDKYPTSNKLYLEHVHLNQDEIQKTGKYSLEGLFARLGHNLSRI